MRILNFDHPQDCFYFLEHDMWCRALAGAGGDNGRMRMQVGVTAFGVHLSGDFFMCRPKPVGSAVLQGQTLALAELSKTVVTIKSPVSGTVLQTNPLLATSPEAIHQDPYGSGWLAVLSADRWPQDMERLAHGAALQAAALARMRLEKLQ